MIDIPAIFQHKTLEEGKLLAYGFSRGDKGCGKDVPILEGQYIVRIFVSEGGTVDFRVFEAESGEEYLPAHVYNAAGAFVGDIHRACEEVLRDVAQTCSTAACFQWAQTERMLQFVSETYHVAPEFLWPKFPETSVLRVAGKKPWFALVGRVPRSKLGLADESDAEIINLKDLPENVTAKVDGKHVFPAYHMNKQHWYTIILDDSIADETLFSWISASYSLAGR